MRVDELAVAALPTDPPSAAKNAEAAEAFEAYMVAFLAQQMRATVPDGPLSSGPIATFAGLFDQEIGRRVAERGGLGLREQLEAALAGAGVVMPAAGDDPLRAAPVGALPVEGTLTSGFGMRQDPFTHEARAHRGIDLGAPTGTSVHAALAGTVVFAGERGSYGKLVIVEHADGSQTRYAHCDALRVEAGAVVAAGAELATVGETGRATGPHLHFEVREGGRAIDPAAWLRRVGGRPPT